MPHPSDNDVIRVVIADDQDLVRSGLRAILEAESGLVVVGEAANGSRAAMLAAREAADVVLMDVEMPGSDGIAGLRQTLAARRDVRVLMLTMFDLDDYVFQALRAGASGFLLKTVSPEELITAIREVHEGGRALAPSVVERLVSTYVSVPSTVSPAPSELDVLSAREREVVLAIANGRSNAEISSDLHLSIATVKTYITRILAKLDLRDRVQLAILAYESGAVIPQTASTLRAEATELSTFGD